MEWSDLRHVLAAARAGTLAAAARRLGVNQTTVSRRIAAAEAALGVRLFDRVDGMLRPTREGEAAVARAAQIEREVEALARGIGGADAAPAGVVRLTTVPILANRLLVPAVPKLHAAYPLLQIELIAEFAQSPSDAARGRYRAAPGAARNRHRAGAAHRPARLRRLRPAPQYRRRSPLDHLRGRAVAICRRRAGSPRRRSRAAPPRCASTMPRRSYRRCAPGSASRCCPALSQTTRRGSGEWATPRPFCRAKSGSWSIANCAARRASLP